MIPEVVQPSLFEASKCDGFPKLMDGFWNGFLALAIVDTPEQMQALIERGYEVVKDSG